MIPVQGWIDSGYEKFSAVRHVKPYAAFGLQKLISDHIGKRYYITVFVYDNTNHKASGRMPETSPDYSFSPDVQFSGEINTTCVELIMHENSTIKDVEIHFDILWNALGKPYDETFV